MKIIYAMLLSLALGACTVAPNSGGAHHGHGTPTAWGERDWSNNGDNDHSTPSAPAQSTPSVPDQPDTTEPSEPADCRT